MKKVLFLNLVLFMCLGAFAQNKELSVLSNNLDSKMNLEATDVNLNAKALNLNKRIPSNTRADARWYDIVDAVDQTQGASGAIYSNASFIYPWMDSTLLAPYGDGGGGTVYEPNWMKSLAQVIDPTDPIFNDLAYYAGLAHIDENQSYIIDSVNLQYVYYRNASKASIVDTMVISVVFGDGTGGQTQTDVGGGFFAPGSTTSTNHGTDTLSIRYGYLDQNTYEFKASSAGNVYNARIPLTTATVNDTTSDGFNYISLPVGLNVPPGNVAVMSATFVSGDTWTPLVDTLYVSPNGTTPNFNYVRFITFEELDNSYQNYNKGYFNSSQLMQNDTSGWGENHVPSFAYTDQGYGYEHHWWQWKLNSTSAWSVGFDEVAKNINFKAYPNPTSNVVSFDLNLNESAKDVNIRLFSMSGQLIKTVNLGSLNSGQNQEFDIDLREMSKGMYIFSLDVDGQVMSDRLIIE